MVKVFQVLWLLRPYSFKPIIIPTPELLIIKVSELMDDSGDWKWDKLNEILWEVDRDEVTRIAVGDGGDKLIWHYASKGEYTVSSGYHLAMREEESGSSGSSCGYAIGLRKMWNLKTPNKFKIHVWRLLFNALSVCTNLIGRGLHVDVIYPCCNSHPDDISHMFWYCKFAQKVWRLLDLWPILDGFDRGGFGELFQWVVEHDRGSEVEKFSLLCWILWDERNKIVFKKKVKDWEDVIGRARRMKDNFLQLPSCPRIITRIQMVTGFNRLKVCLKSMLMLRLFLL